MQELAELEEEADGADNVDKRAFFTYRDYALEVWETDELLGHTVKKMIAVAKKARNASAATRNRHLQRKFGGGRGGRTVTTGW